MPENTSYRYATWILAAIVLVLLIVLAKSRGGETVTGTFEDINERITECRSDLARWRSQNPGVPATTTATTTGDVGDAQEDLEDIFERCMEAVEDAQERI